MLDHKMLLKKASRSMCRKPARISNLDFCGNGANPDQIFASWLRWGSALHGNQAAEIESSVSVELNDSTAAAISICTIRTKPAAVFLGPRSFGLGARGANHASISYPPRATSAQSETLRPQEDLDCSGLCMVHIEMVAAVESFSSTETLDSTPGTWSPGDEPGR